MRQKFVRRKNVAAPLRRVIRVSAFNDFCLTFCLFVCSLHLEENRPERVEGPEKNVHRARAGTAGLINLLHLSIVRFEQDVQRLKSISVCASLSY